MKCFLIMIVAAAAALPLAAQSFPEGGVSQYIDAVDAVMLPVNCRAKMSVLDTFATGDDRTSEGFFLRRNNQVVWVATAPASQKNFALLRNEDLFWERLATTNKVVKTSATASSRGGETSNLDLTRFNTNLDYTVSYIGRDTVNGASCYRFELKAKNRKLAYGLVNLWVDPATRMPVKRAFYAVSGKMLKYYTVSSVELAGGRVASVEMTYVDALKPEDTSSIRIYDITPIDRVPAQFFTKEYLESGRLFPFDF
ncbi:MAG TPA: outer membrane lipoprotein-sorting protein [Spirochaetia bacterium]|nr:outer membrane lipoprotein-sorting protein [Spirochaetia bacterium]